MSFGLRIFVVALALQGAACSWLPALLEPDLESLRRSLKLEITDVKKPEWNKPADVSLKLTNQSAIVVKACLGPSRSLSYSAPGGGGTRSTDIDHPGCIKEFVLQPAGEMTWNEHLDVPTTLVAGLELEVTVEIVEPRSCGGWGCSAIQMRSIQYVVR